jgi:organic hydroperoxide reductase OsmC/OhrA
MAEHRYELFVRWTGGRSIGTTGYRDYDRAHEVSAAGKSTIAGSSDPAFRGEAERWNPEELLVASLSQCHLLWYLHLATTAGIVVLEYQDDPVGTMAENPDGSGQFSNVLLRPRVCVSEPAMVERAQALHEQVDAFCFIARSVNFPVRHQAVTVSK